MKKRGVRFINIVIVLVIIISLTGCYNPKKFRNPIIGAYIVQIENSLFGVSSESFRDTKYIVIEEDDFGRKMYLFVGKTWATVDYVQDNEEKVLSILIQQKTDNEFVYYYDDFCFIVEKFDNSINWNVDDQYFLNVTYSEIANEEIERLMANNDWNKPINEEKCIKKPILDINYKTKASMVKKHKRQEVFELMCEYEKPFHVEYFLRYLTSDDYNRHIYFFRTSNENFYYTNSYVLMFFPDNTYVIQEIFDIWNYQEELRNFKYNNSWNSPID